jgi:hypothetical protein
MAATPLVEHDLERGAALISALERAAIPIDFVAWSYSDDDEEWRLIIATPLVDSDRRVASYEKIREVSLRSPGLTRELAELSSSVQANRESVGSVSLRKAPITEDLATYGERGVIRGRPVDASYVYNTAALRFEESLFAALQRLTPPSAVLRRAGKVFESPRDVDFVLHSGRGMVSCRS